MKAEIVVGLGYGDEGKGITTDYLCSNTPVPKLTCVVRYSGGQQAGHTVMLDDIKHIFSNFGAGTLRGIPTYFSEHTTFYPVSIAKELYILNLRGIKNPKLMIHPMAKLTTPYDVFANRRCTDNVAHGTCGLGIGKTVERNEDGKCQLYAVDLKSPQILVQKLQSIKTYYGFNDTTNCLSEAEINEVEAFTNAVNDIDWQICNYAIIKDNYKYFIFEGAQGVLLDRDHGVYPHNTYTHTTSRNAHDVCDKLGIESRDMYYITRAYSTRHGNGPFTRNSIQLKNDEQEINVHNEWQGSFKKSKMNYELLNYALHVDSIYSLDKFYSVNLVVTCNDQIVNDEDKFDISQVDFAFDHVIMSNSPRSKDFTKFM